jgi:hypothetical protein
VTDQTQIAVTICQPGRKSKIVAERLIRESPIPLTTATALRRPLAASIVPPARNDRRTLDERVEAALRADAVSVALAQPHRAGSDDPLSGSALGRYCLRRWPGEHRRGFREDRCEAGNRYAVVIDNDRVACGFSPRLFGGVNGSDKLSEQELRDRRVECAKARADAEAQIRDIPRAVAVMSRLCWEDRECGPYDEDVMFHALYRLAMHFGIQKRGFHENDA